MRYPLFSCGLALSLMGQSASVPVEPSEPAPQLVSEALRNETSAYLAGVHFTYTSFGRSSRTNHQLWEEEVVQIEQGTIRRLIAIDRQPLSPEKQKIEDARIARLVNHPAKARESSPDSSQEDKDRQRILRALTTAFTFKYGPEVGGCRSIHFVPNSAFKPANYQERIISLVEGTAYVDVSQKRFCGIDGTLSQKVEIGLGLLGSLEKGGVVHVERTQVAPGTWENSEIQLHVVGKMFVFRDASQDIDEKRTNIREVPAHLTLAQAAELTKRPAKPPVP